MDVGRQRAAGVLRGMATPKPTALSWGSRLPVPLLVGPLLQVTSHRPSPSEKPEDKASVDAVHTRQCPGHRQGWRCAESGSGIPSRGNNLTENKPTEGADYPLASNAGKD